jgi:hypothetical protein
MPRFASSVTEPSEQELEQRLAPVIPGVDSGRAVVAQRALSLEQARLRGAEREASRLAFKYGANSERATAATEAVRVAQRRITALDLEVERTRAVVQPDPNGIIVHGRVLDAKFQGVPNLTVTILDPGGKQFARTLTDKQGSFSLAGDAIPDPAAATATTGTGAVGVIASPARGAARRRGARRWW